MLNSFILVPSIEKGEIRSIDSKRRMVTGSTPFEAIKTHITFFYAVFSKLVIPLPPGNTNLTPSVEALSVMKITTI